MRMCAALVAVAIAGCGGRRSEPAGSASRDGGARAHVVPAPDGPKARPSLDDAPAIDLPREMSFAVGTAGDEPRTRLRYRLDGPARELVARSQVTTRGNLDGTWSDEVALAGMRDGFGVTVSPGVVLLRGLEAQIDDGPPAVVAASRAYLARWRALLERRRVDMTIDDRGRLTGSLLVDDPTGAQIDARDEVVQRWLGLAVPLPADPVGVGATWQVVTALRAGGVVLKQTASYRLVAADATTWTLEVTSERIGEPQDILVPGKRQAMGELVALRRVVTGTVVIGRSDPLPLRGSLTADVTSHARLDVGGRRREQVSEDRATIELGPR